MPDLALSRALIRFASGPRACTLDTGFGTCNSSATMADDKDTPGRSGEQPEQPAQPTSSVETPNTPTSQPSQPEDRSELLERARTFLRSPQVVHEDAFAKRKFLAQKGLNDGEVETLIQELVSDIVLHPASCSHGVLASSDATTDVSPTSTVKHTQPVDRCAPNNQLGCWWLDCPAIGLLRETSQCAIYLRLLLILSWCPPEVHLPEAQSIVPRATIAAQSPERAPHSPDSVT